MPGSAFAVTHHAFSSGAGRTSDGNGSHASTLKSPSYTKSVSWQHYLKMFKSSIRNIFYPSRLERLSRFQFIIYTLTSWSILITLNDINLALSFILVINNTYVNINIGAKRIRDTGCKAIYFVLISLGLTLFSIISAAIEGVRCESLSVQLNVAWILFTTIMLSAIPSAKMSLSAH